MPGPPDAYTRAAEAARVSYGRLIALLASGSGDLAGAEDALSDAFERALRLWPADGVPANPDGWLLTVARNRRRDAWRSAAARTSTPLDPDRHARAWYDVEPDAIPDHRLALMLACTHPEISPAVHTPLMLSATLGYTAAQIGRAFDVPATTMAARLTRAKKGISRSGIEFATPTADEVPARIAPVLEAIYGAFTIEFATVSRARHALLLGLIDVVAEVSGSAEARGLAALMYLGSARFPARIDAAGDFVPLARQDPDLWDAGLLRRGREHLRVAHAYRSIGRFQLEAAISAMHCARRETGTTDWSALRGLHDALSRLAPTLGGAVARAAVLAECEGPSAALATLDELGDRTARYQPAWVLRAELLRRRGRHPESAAALGRAIALTTDPAERAHLMRQASRQPGRYIP